MSSNSACNVYKLREDDPYWLDRFVQSINAITWTTIFNDVAEAIYAIRLYPFMITDNWVEKYNELIPVYNTGLQPGGDKIKRQICFRHATFDCRRATAIYERLKNARTFGDAQIFLPYIGFSHIDLSDFYGHVVYVYYAVDLASGECSVMLESDNTIVSIINGKIGEDCFYANTNAAQLFRQNLVTGTAAAAGAIAHVAAGDYVGAASTAAAGVGKIAANQVDHVARGQIGSSGVGRNGAQGAYIIIECYDPNEDLTEFASLRGRPLERATSLSGLSGYTEFADVHLNVPNALEDEKAELESLLKSGVIL